MHGVQPADVEPDLAVEHVALDLRADALGDRVGDGLFAEARHRAHDDDGHVFQGNDDELVGVLEQEYALDGGIDEAGHHPGHGCRDHHAKEPQRQDRPLIADIVLDYAAYNGPVAARLRGRGGAGRCQVAGAWVHASAGLARPRRAGHFFVSFYVASGSISRWIWTTK